MLLAALVLALAAPAAACPAPEAPDLTLGPADAPTTVRAWLDPIDPTSLVALVELRRLVADEGGRLRVEIDLARGDGRRQPPADRVRTWAIGLAARGRLEHGLREVARDGTERVVARLASARSRAQLAQDVGLPPGEHEPLVTDDCAADKLEANAAAVAQHYADNPASIRLPVFELPDLVFDDAPTLDRLRPELGRLGLSSRRDVPPPMTLPLKATSAIMRRPPLSGVTLGGTGLPHLFVVHARDEEDASLFMMLPTVLAARSQRPGQLAVQVVARGSSLGATELRHRLCAARILGREVAYIQVLASDPPSRERPPRDVVELLRALDKVPEKRCEDEVDPAQLDLPDGAWLDGLPRARAELANLETTLALLSRSRRPLAPIMSAGPSRRDD